LDLAKLNQKYLPTKQEFFQNPIGWLSGAWVISSALTATLLPRATVISLTILGLIILVDALVKKRPPPLPPGALVIAVASIFLLAATSALWSVAPDETLRRLPRAGPLFLWGLLALAAAHQATPRIAGWTMTLTTAAFIMALIVIAIEINFDYTIYRSLTSLLSQTVKPSYVNSNIINQPALLVALYLWPVTLTLWLRDLRIFSIALIVLTLVVFLPSSSQSVGLALMFGILAACLAAALPRLMRVCFSLAIIGLMVVLPVIPQFLQSMFRGNEDTIAISGLHRLEIWNFVAGKILERPFSGYGLEASRILADGIPSITIPGTALMSLHPHNGFLQIWLELGLAGYLVLGLLCLWIIHKISLLKGAGMAFSTGLFVSGLSLFSTAFGMWQSWIIAVEFSAAGALLLALKLAAKPQQTPTLTNS